MRKSDQGSEFAKAKQYFSAHPDVKKIRRSRSKKGSSEFFSHSYIKTTHEIQDQQGHTTTEEGIYKVLSKQEGGLLGAGSFGRVKIVEDENGQRHVVKVMPMKDDGDVQSSQKEANITKQVYGSKNVSDVMYVISQHTAGASSSQDMGFLSEDIRDLRKKSYQVIPLFRCSMEAHMQKRPQLPQHATEEQENVDLKTRIGFAIDLFTQLQLLHDKKIAHRDIKPENILIGSAGELYFIDFGLSRISTDTHPITQGSSVHCGTSAYLPAYRGKGLSDMQRDIFAAMRTCYFPYNAGCISSENIKEVPELQQTSIFNENAFGRLPMVIQQLFLTSTTLNSRRELEENYQTILPRWKTPHFLAAVLILYQNDTSIDDRRLQTEIDKLKDDPSGQKNLIETYYNKGAAYAAAPASATPTDPKQVHPGAAAFDVVEIRSPATPTEYIQRVKTALDDYAKSKQKNQNMFSLFNRTKNLDQELYTTLSTQLLQVGKVDDKNPKNLDHANRIIENISKILLQYDEKYKNIRKNATSSSSLIAHLRVEGLWPNTSPSPTSPKLDTSSSDTPKTPGCK